MSAHDFSDIPQGQGTIRRLKCIAAAVKRIEAGATEAEVVKDFVHRGYTQYKGSEYFQTANEWIHEAGESPEGKKRLSDALRAAFEAGKKEGKTEKQKEGEKK